MLFVWKKNYFSLLFVLVTSSTKLSCFKLRKIPLKKVSSEYLGFLTHYMFKQSKVSNCIACVHKRMIDVKCPSVGI